MIYTYVTMGHALRAKAHRRARVSRKVPFPVDTPSASVRAEGAIQACSQKKTVDVRREQTWATSVCNQGRSRMDRHSNLRSQRSEVCICVRPRRTIPPLYGDRKPVHAARAKERRWSRETLSTNIYGKREKEEQGRLGAVELTVCADNIQLDRLHSGVFTCARSHAHKQ